MQHIHSVVLPMSCARRRVPGHASLLSLHCRTRVPVHASFLSLHDQTHAVQLWAALAQHLGSSIFQRLVVCLTHGCTSPPRGFDFTAFAERRTEQLGLAIKRATGVLPPTVIVEHGPRCAVTDGERTLPDNTVWRSELLRSLTEMAGRFSKGAKLVFKPHNPNRSRIWVVPLIFAVQMVLRYVVFTRVIERDFDRGNKHGEFDKEVIECVDPTTACLTQVICLVQSNRHTHAEPQHGVLITEAVDLSFSSPVQVYTNS